MDEKKEEKVVIESQKEEIKTDTEKTERSRNRTTKIKQIKVKKGIRNAVIVVIAIIAIFIAMLILDKSQHTFNGQVLKLVGITEKKQEDEEDKKERAKAVKVAQEKFKELGGIYYIGCMFRLSQAYAQEDADRRYLCKRK